MSRLIRICLALTCLVTLCGVSVGSVEFAPVFNGRNLDGWEAVGSGKWTAEDGVLVQRRTPGDHGGGWLVTRKDYGDFVLRLKFRPGTKMINSGILVRDPGHAKVGRPAVNGFEIKIAQGDGRVENSNGAIWNAGDAYIREIPADEWTSFEIRCAGDHISTFMNGRKMAEAHSRRSYRGAIGLHLHGGDDQPEYRWKDIEVLELPPAPQPYLLDEEKVAQAPGNAMPPFDSLDSFESVQKDDWALDGGILRGSGAQNDAWLSTRQSYGNFLLTFDFRVTGNGDGGVAFRVPAGAGGSSGIEYRVNNSEGEDPSGSLFQLARSFVHDPCLLKIQHPERWNQARVYALGDHVVSYLNLAKVAEVHSGRSLRGRIAFHATPGSVVEYRNIAIKTMK